MSTFANGGFARIRKQALISVAVLSVITTVGAATSPVNAMGFGRSFGGFGGHMGGFAGFGHSSFGGLGHSMGGRSLGDLGHTMGSRSSGGLGGFGGSTRPSGHHTAASSHLASGQTGGSHATADRGRNAQAHATGGHNQVDSRPVAADKPVDKPANGDRVANNGHNTDSGRDVGGAGGMKIRPGTEKPGPAMRDTVELNRDDDVGKRVERHFDDKNGKIVDTIVATVSYGSTPESGLVRVDDLPKNREKVQDDCALLRAKVAALTKQLVWKQSVLAGMSGGFGDLSGTLTGTSTTFGNSEARAQAIAGVQEDIQVTGQLLARYQADINRCLSNQAALAAARDPQAQGAGGNNQSAVIRPSDKPANNSDRVASNGHNQDSGRHVD
jgi:hypothetical protein